jgi:hypothetical protein
MTRSVEQMWTRDEAHEVCAVLEGIISKHGCHVGLTGGVLYKAGPRKDCDVVVYRAGQPDPTEERPPFHEEIDRPAMVAALEFHGFVLVKEYTRVVKILTSNGKSVDLIFPECDGAYEEEDETDPDPDLAMEKARDDKQLQQTFADPSEALS